VTGDAQADEARLRAQVAELRDRGLTYRAIGAELTISPATAWRYHEAWIRELRQGDPDLRNRAADALREQHEMIRRERERLEQERATVVEVLTARHLTVSHGTVITDENGEPLEDDAPVLAAQAQLNAIRDREVKLADHEAKLLGLYAKTEVNHTGTVKYEVVGLSGDELT
jgi:hypothetical protein